MAARQHTEQRRPESYTWPLLAIGLLTALQLLVPGRDRIGPPLIVPIVQGIVFVAGLAIAAKPGPVPQSAHPFVLTMFGVLVVANTGNAFHLVAVALDIPGTHGVTATRLLAGGALALVTNIVTFGLLYWQLDGGGPGGRATQPKRFPDFQFPQTATDGLAAPDWRPEFFDYLYVAYTNVFALSPTDTMPLTRRAKGLMTVQSAISGAVLVVVVSRVINLLPT